MKKTVSSMLLDLRISSKRDMHKTNEVNKHTKVQMQGSKLSSKNSELSKSRGLARDMNTSDNK
jgi:hypothetical protein